MEGSIWEFIHIEPGIEEVSSKHLSWKIDLGYGFFHVYIYILYTLIFFFHQVTASFVEKAFCNIYLISKSGAASSNWNTSMDLLLEPIYLDMWTVRNHYCNMYDNDSRWSLCGWLNHPLVCCVPSGCWVSWTLIWMFQLELVNGIRRHGIYIPTSGLVYTLIHPYT